MANYNSFYGGRRGASFVIVKKYKTIYEPDMKNDSWQRVICRDLDVDYQQENFDFNEVVIKSKLIDNWLYDNCMVYCFSQAGAYNVVNYEEYVLIDTPNKNDKDNGKIFRRGYAYDNEIGGAEYIGQIVGPAGMAPQVEMTTIKNVEDLTKKEGLVLEGHTETDDGIEHEQYVETTENGDKLYYRTSIGEYAPSENLLPGQYYDEEGEKFNDSIQWTMCSIRDEWNSDTIAHVGFKIPYMVTQYTSESVSPYYHRDDMEPENLTGDDKWNKWDEVTDVAGSTAAAGVEKDKFNNLELIKRTDNLSHPFFSRWDIKVPKGIKGDAFKRLRVTTVEAELAKGTTIIGQDNQPIILQDYDGYTDDNLNNKDEFEHSYKKRQILVYDYYHYDRVSGGDPVALYLGDYNMIDRFQIDEDGTIRIIYSHDDTDYYPNYLKAVDSVKLNPETGLLEVDYNFDQQYERDENGDFKLDEHNNKIPIEGTETHYQTYLQWVKDITYDQNGTITWYYTYKDNEENHIDSLPNFLKWVERVELDTEDGNFDMYFNYETEPDGAVDDEGNNISGQSTHYNTRLNWVKDISFEKDGSVILHHTKDGDERFNKLIKWIDEIRLDPKTGMLKIIYNHLVDDSGKETTLNQYLKWVKDVTLEDDGTLTFYYTDGEESEGHPNVENSQFKEYPNIIKWIKSISLDKETGHFNITFNDNTDSKPSKYDIDLTWVKNIDFKEDGSIHFDYTTGEKDYENFIKWITNVNLNEETGQFTVDFNYGGEDTQYTNRLNWVKDIIIDEEGTITIKYTQEEDTVLFKWFKTIVDASLNPETGKFEIIFNQKDEDGNPIKYETTLKWVNNVTIENNGTVTFYYTTGEEKKYENYFKSIDSFDIDPETGKLTITYNNLDEDGNPIKYENDLDWIKGVEYNYETGTFTFKHTVKEDTVFVNAIRTIKNMSLNSNNGLLTVYYNNGTDEYPPTQYLYFSYPKDLEVDTGAIEGEGSQTLQALMTTGTKKSIGRPLNYIMKTAVTDDYHLIVLYSDPARRNEIVASGKNREYEGRNDWLDLGLVRNDNVICIAAYEGDAEAEALARTMPNRSIWFILDEDGTETGPSEEDQQPEING